MNIWIINQYAIPLEKAGGTRHATIAKYLAELGYQTTIFASDPHVLIDKDKLYVDTKYNGYNFRYIKTPKYKNVIERFYSMIVFKRNVVKAAIGLLKPDVIIGSTVHLHGADAGRVLAKKLNVPFVFEIRDIWPQTLVDIGAMSKLNPVYWYLRKIELKLLKSADKIITLFPGANLYLANNRVENDRTLYLPNGIDVDLYPSNNSTNEKPSNFTAMFFGAHGPANGLDTVVKAAHILQTKNKSKIKIKMIGDGVIKPSLMKLASDLELSNIEFISSLPKLEIFKVALDADCFIFHLKYMKVLDLYGISPNKLFDYLMLKKPVIFACKSFNDPVSESKAGLSIEPENPEMMADALIELSEMPESVRIKMGVNGHDWVRKHHDFKTNVRSMEKMLLELIS